VPSLDRMLQDPPDAWQVLVTLALVLWDGMASF
jgi:hypothetical protein